MKLPDNFLNAAADDFAGGVELAFMSTTLDPSVAVTYSGKGPGSIFIIDFGIASRGASLQFLSQFPHEAELLFPPNTMLECKEHTARSNKRLVVVAPTVSTARPDTSGISTPADVPKQPGSGGGSSSSPTTLTLPQKVAKIKTALGLDDALVMGEAVKQANEMTGKQPEGAVPVQVDALMRELNLS